MPHISYPVIFNNVESFGQFLLGNTEILSYFFITFDFALSIGKTQINLLLPATFSYLRKGWPKTINFRIMPDFVHLHVHTYYSILDGQSSVQKLVDKAVADGILDYVTGTNLTYRMPELLTRDWYVDVDVSKYAAYFVVALNHDMSVSSIIDPLKKIENLLANRK